VAKLTTVEIRTNMPDYVLKAIGSIAKKGKKAHRKGGTQPGDAGQHGPVRKVLKKGGGRHAKDPGQKI